MHAELRYDRGARRIDPRTSSGMTSSAAPDAGLPFPPPRSEDLAESLARAILEHRLAPGARLPEDEVGEVFGVGRTVVRGALQGLAHRELVTLQRNRGAFVARPEPARGPRGLRGAGAARAAHGRIGGAARAPGRPQGASRRTSPRSTRPSRAGDIGRAVYLSGTFHNRSRDRRPGDHRRLHRAAGGALGTDHRALLEAPRHALRTARP